MNIRQNAIAKLQQLPESLLPEVDNFINFVLHKHQSETANEKRQDDVAKVWDKWFEAVDHLKVNPTEPVSEYQQLLLNKYRKQANNETDSPSEKIGQKAEY